MKLLRKLENKETKKIPSQCSCIQNILLSKGMSEMSQTSVTHCGVLNLAAFKNIGISNYRI